MIVFGRQNKKGRVILEKMEKSPEYIREECRELRSQLAILSRIVLDIENQLKKIQSECKHPGGSYPECTDCGLRDDLE